MAGQGVGHAQRPGGEISLPTIKDIIDELNARFDAQQPNGVSIPTNSGIVGIILDVDNQHGAERWNYTLPWMYYLHDGNLADLQNWWAQKHPSSGHTLSRVEQHHVLYHFLFQTTGGRRFNFHIVVEHH